jgi:hypothetical protein
MQTEWTTLERFEDVDQALYHREALENAGITVRVFDDNETGPPPLPPAPAAYGGVLLQVPAEEAQRAATVLEEEASRLMGGR